MDTLTSTRPYLIRAIYDWIVDNQLTPHLLIAVTDKDVMVPQQFVEDGKIVLNVSPNAVRDLNLGNESVSFNARFGGVPQDIYAPMSSVRAIYARENGQGISLGEDDDRIMPEQTLSDGVGDAPVDGDKPKPKQSTAPAKAPHLTIVK